MRTRSIIMGLMALGAAITFMPAPAQAEEYCREYTRTVYIGNRQEVAYGTACYQPNGDWKIVDESDENRIGQRFRNEDVTNAGYVPVYQPVYQPVSRTYYYRTVPQRSQIVFVNYDRGNKYGHYKKHHHDHYDRYDRRDRGRDRDWDDHHRR